MDYLNELLIFSGYKLSSVQKGDSKKSLGPIQKKHWQIWNYEIIRKTFLWTNKNLQL